MKISVDGAFKQYSMGAGIIIQDAVGKVRAAIKCRLRGIVNASHAKILAIWKGIEFAREQ